MGNRCSGGATDCRDIAPEELAPNDPTDFQSGDI